MRNPVKVHEDYGEWHPIVAYPPFDHYYLERLQSVWDVNEWFNDAYRNPNLWPNYERLLKEIVYRSPSAITCGGNYDTSPNFLGLNDRHVFNSNEMIKTRMDSETSDREKELGFRIVRNR